MCTFVTDRRENITVLMTSVFISINEPFTLLKLSWVQFTDEL